MKNTHITETYLANMKIIQHNKHTTAPSLTVAFKHKSSGARFPGLDSSRRLNILLVDYVVLFSLFLLLFALCFLNRSVSTCLVSVTEVETTQHVIVSPVHFLRARLHQKVANLHRSYSEWRTVDSFLTLHTGRHVSPLSHRQRNRPLRHTPAPCEWADILQRSVSSFYTQISMGVVTRRRPLSLFSLLTRS